MTHKKENLEEENTKKSFTKQFDEYKKRLERVEQQL